MNTIIRSVPLHHVLRLLVESMGLVTECTFSFSCVSQSSLDAQWDSNADSAPEEKTKKAKKGSSNRREKSPTHTAASSRRRKQPIPISADSDQGNSGRDSSAEERQKASRRLAKKA